MHSNENYPKNVLCTNKVIFIDNPSEKLIKTLKSQQFYQYCLKYADRIGNAGLGIIPGLIRDYLSSINYEENKDRDDFS
jgi:hypothetical protein